MQINIPLDGGALLIAGNHLSLGLWGDGNAPHQADGQDLGIGLTDVLIARVFPLHFPENVPKAGGYFLAFIGIQNAEPAVGVGIACQFHTADAKDDVFQRLSVPTGFRMGDVGIDDDQVVHIHGIDLSLNQKLPLTADDEEQLCVIMSVGNGMPVTAVSAAGGIQKLYMAANGGGLALTVAVMKSAHGKSSPCKNFIYIGIIPKNPILFNREKKSVHQAQKVEDWWNLEISGQ